MRHRILVLASAALTLLPVPATRSTGIVWPTVQHKIGAYFIGVEDPSEVAIAASHGLSLSLMAPNFATPRLMRLYARYGMQYVDDYPWGQIQQTCGTLSGVGRCSLTPAQKQRILADVRRHLAETADDPRVAGYMVLDDYPGGDVRDVLRAIHRELVNISKRSHLRRPTQCDFGGRTDWKTSAAGPWRHDDSAFDKAATNFSAKACDTVELYPYCYNDPALVRDDSYCDWSMSRLLPHMVAALESHGWDPRTEPMVGSPQAYAISAEREQAVNGNTIWLVQPRGADIARQTKAYCQAGAQELDVYAWDDPAHRPADKTELYSSGDYLGGYLHGAETCRRRWSTRQRVSRKKHSLPSRDAPCISRPHPHQWGIPCIALAGAAVVLKVAYYTTLCNTTHVA